MSDRTVPETPLSVDAVMSQFGGRMEVGLQLRTDMGALELAKFRAMTRQRVRICTGCHLESEKGCHGPVALEGPATGGTARILVIGEAPGKVEDGKGRPFIGPAGKLMRALMSGAGFDMDEVAWCNTISCFPTGRATPTPTREEMVACRGNLRDQVVASGATYVLLVGGIATSTWRGDLKVSEVHGRVFVWGGMWVVMPVFHPAAVLRDMTKKPVLKRDVEKYARVVGGDLGLGALEVVCVKCGEGVEHYDPDGVGFCGRHWLKYGGQWRVELGKWSNERAVVKVKRGPGKKATVLIEGQGEML